MSGKKQKPNVPEEIALEKVRIDGGTQPRAAIDQEYVTELATALEDGVALPPVDVVADGATYWLVDGFHRYHAHRKCSFGHIAATVTPGTQADAQWLSYQANQQQDTVGLRRSNADKRRAVLAALSHPKGESMSDNAIAEHCGVSGAMVGIYRRSMSQPKPAAKAEPGEAQLQTVYSSPVPDTEPDAEAEAAAEVRTCADGRKRNVAKIGKAKPAPAATATEAPEPVGLARAAEAIEILGSIPADDPQRAEGMAGVRTWINENIASE
jgi:hypothetical protein